MYDKNTMLVICMWTYCKYLENVFKGLSQLHICFCFQVRVWVGYYTLFGACWNERNRCVTTKYFHSWINIKILILTSRIFIYFLLWPLTWKHAYTDRYLFESPKIVCLLFVMRSRSIGMPFWKDGVIRSEKYSAVRTTAIWSEKNFVC